MKKLDKIQLKGISFLTIMGILSAGSFALVQSYEVEETKTTNIKIVNEGGQIYYSAPEGYTIEHGVGIKKQKVLKKGYEIIIDNIEDLVK